ncbi:hypothetical protein PS833_05973 [Pseudomonas fluorescens]|uniref:Uncharacterized protein n=1 Tax=Pseudomonas fluorescens TaxID=294 RepID=A0A5E7FSB2_PSEFL|nr:hypothetical protein PS833_05973 [Pseudomonas fluorescens]
MKKLLAFALITSISLPLMAAETGPKAPKGPNAPATTATAPGATSGLSLSTPIAGAVTVGTGLAIGAGLVAVGVAASNSSGGGGNDGTPGTTGGGTSGTTGTTGTTR